MTGLAIGIGGTSERCCSVIFVLASNPVDFRYLGQRFGSSFSVRMCEPRRKKQERRSLILPHVSVRGSHRLPHNGL
jgi:hypothetical protein